MYRHAIQNDYYMTLLTTYVNNTREGWGIRSMCVYKKGQSSLEDGKCARIGSAAE